MYDNLSPQDIIQPVCTHLLGGIMNSRDLTGDLPPLEFTDICREIKEIDTPEMIHSGSEDLFRTLFVSSPIGIFIVQDGKFKAVNPQFQVLTGYNRSELYNLDSMTIVFPDDRNFVRQSAASMLKGQQTTPYEYRIVTKDGSIKWILETISSIQYNGRPASLGNFMDIQNLKQTEEKLRFLSMHDPLTGLYNRMYFEEEMNRIQSSRFYPVGLLLCDIDGLKLINDTLGHDYGDRLLISASKAIRRGFRESDVVARVGGDEFAILLPNAPLPAVENASKRIHAAIDEYNTGQKVPPLSISCGFAIGMKPSVSMIDLFREADNNMYREKRARRQTIRSLIVQRYIEALQELDFAVQGHMQRLRHLVTALGTAVGLTDGSISRLRLLAEFHDIGKVGVDSRIIFKPAKLNPEETIQIRRHCEIGHRIALISPDLAPISELILKHHEWWNGHGYPLGLRGEEIPIECRIMSITDAYDAMTSNRPYRKPLPHEDALAELRKCSASQFDPQLVDLLSKLPQPVFSAST